jgi:hypothetical protein
MAPLAPSGSDPWSDPGRAGVYSCAPVHSCIRCIHMYCVDTTVDLRSIVPFVPTVVGTTVHHTSIALNVHNYGNTNLGHGRVRPEIPRNRYFYNEFSEDVSTN